ncbi:MAG: tetratricopeptide repeat protein [Nitrospirota bacterium]|jgi:tetratricopeptide (TPR) repeat protein
MSRYRFIFSAVLLFATFAALPALAIDWTENDNVKPPPGAPLGWNHWWAALQYMKEGNCAGAINESSYLLNNPKFSDDVYSQKALILHGECYERLGRLNLAFKAYLRALKQYGKNEDAFLRLADLYLREQNPKAAITAYRGAVATNEASVRGHSGLAAAYLATGQTEKAAAAIARVEELGGDVEELRSRLAAAKN